MKGQILTLLLDSDEKSLVFGWVNMSYLDNAYMTKTHYLLLQLNEFAQSLSYKLLHSNTRWSLQIDWMFWRFSPVLDLLLEQPATLCALLYYSTWLLRSRKKDEWREENIVAVESVLCKTTGHIGEVLRQGAEVGKRLVKMLTSFVKTHATSWWRWLRLLHSQPRSSDCTWPSGNRPPTQSFQQIARFYYLCSWRG